MNTRNAIPAERSALWELIRLPLLFVLTLLAPIVQFLCAAFCVVGVVASIAFEVSAMGPRFPFVMAMSISLGFAVFLVLYRVAIDLLLR